MVYTSFSHSSVVPKTPVARFRRTWLTQQSLLESDALLQASGRGKFLKLWKSRGRSSKGNSNWLCYIINSSSIEELPWYVEKGTIRAYLKEINKEKKANSSIISMISVRLFSSLAHRFSNTPSFNQGYLSTILALPAPLPYSRPRNCGSISISAEL